MQLRGIYNVADGKWYFYVPAVWGIKRYCDPSVCLFQPRL